MCKRIDKLFNAMKKDWDSEINLKTELSTCGEEQLREYEKQYLEKENGNMNEREYIIAKAKELGITAEELGIEPEVKTVTKRDEQLIHEVSKMIHEMELDLEDVRDIINEKYWEDLNIQKKKYKIIEVRMEKTIYKDIYVAMPEDEDTDNVGNYINGLYNLDNDYPDDEEDWEVNDYEVDEDNMTADDVNRRGQDKIWNYDDFEE